MKKRKLGKQLLSVLLCVSMMISGAPMDAFAETGEAAEIAETAESTIEVEDTEMTTSAYTAEEVKAMMNALPEVSALEGMDSDALDAVYMQAQEAADAYEALSEEEKEQLVEELDKLQAIFAYVAGLTETTAADTSAYAPKRTEAYHYVGNCIFANGTAITIEAAPNGTRVWYMDGSAKKYVTNNGENGENLSDWSIFVGSENLDGMRGVNGSVTMTGGTVKKIYAGQYSGYFTGTSNITITGGTVTEYVFCNAPIVTSVTSDYVGTITIFDAVGTTIDTNSVGKADNMVQKTGDTWNVSGNGVIPSGVTLTVNAGETLNVSANATLTNNGTLINNGTMNLYGTVRGNAFTGSGTVNCYAAYIENVTSVSSISAKINGSDYALESYRYRLQDGTLYVWLPNGEAQVTLNGKNYYGVTVAGQQTQLTDSYVGMEAVSIAGIPSEMTANNSLTLSTTLTTSQTTTFTPVITYELVSTTALGTTLDGNTLYAAGAGKVQVKVAVSDGYTIKTETVELTVNHIPVTGLSADVPETVIVNAKTILPKVQPSNASYQTITWSVVSGQSETGAVINDGVLTASKSGTFTIRATVENGKAYGTAYTKEFTVKVVAIDSSSSLDISAGSVTISENADGTLKVEYSGYGGDGYKNYAASDLIIITGTTEENSVTVQSGSPKVVLSDCSITSSTTSSPFEIKSGAVVNLILEGTNSFKGTYTGVASSNKNAGLHVPKGAAVTIDGTGILNVQGGSYCAGIGSGVNESGGNIAIAGGTIVTNGGVNGAGIGGAMDQNYSKNGPNKYNGGTISITGGTVTATGGSGAAGIGGGWYGAGGTVTITGGNVKAYSKSANDIGAGYSASGGTLTDGNGNSVSKVTLTLDGLTDAVSLAGIAGSSYGVNGVSTLDTNKLYFYLPAGSSVTGVSVAGGQKFAAKTSGAATLYCTHEKVNEDDCCGYCGAYAKKTEPALDAEDTYLIGTLEELLWFADAVNAGQTEICGRLTSDIDTAKTTKIGIGSSDSPYEGTFDGDGYTLKISLDSFSQYMAPFPYVNDATIKNLTLEGTITTSEKFSASIVGMSQGTTTIENCLSSVEISSTVNGDGTHGGLIANVSSGTMTINNCGFIGAINGSDTTNCGGLVGWSNGTSKITNSYVAVTAGVNTSGCYTFSRNPNNVTITKCYYLQAFGDVNSGAVQKTEAQFKSGEVCYLLNSGVTDGTQIWYQSIETEDYPKLAGATVYGVQKTCSVNSVDSYSNTKPEIPEHTYDANGICNAAEGEKHYQPAAENVGIYEISNVGQMFWFAAYVNAGNKTANGKLMADLDMNNAEWVTIGSTGLYYDTTTYADAGYAGVFDGNGHVISDLTVKGVSGQKVSCGLFGTLSGTVKHLGVENLTFDLNSASDVRTGAVAGQIIGGTVSDCYVKNAVINPKSYVVGGIAGCNYAGLIENCYVVKSTIQGSSNRYGQIAGDNYGDISNTDRVGTIKNCYTDGSSITGSTKTGTVTDCVKGVSEAAFTSGEITYKLNGSTDKGALVWYQTLESDTYPVFAGGTVYLLNDTYTNTPHTHDWTYTVSGMTITATCENTDGNCEDKDGGSITLDVADAYYTGNDVAASVTGTFTNGAVYAITCDEKAASDSSGTVGLDGSIGNHTVVLTVSENGTVKKSVTKTYEISYLLAPESAYGIDNGYKDEKDTYWFKEGAVIKISAPEEYTIATALGGSYGASVSLSESKVVYLKNSKGEMTDQVAVTETISFDQTAPAGKIEIQNRGTWEKLLNKISFGLFFKGEKTAVVTAEDTDSGVKEVKYYLTDSDLIADPELSDADAISKLEAAVAGNWSTYSDEIALNEKAKNVIYVKITDNVDHVTYINSEGVVLYADAAADTKTVTTTYKANVDKNISVVLNGNTIQSVANGDKTLTGDTDYTVNENTITLKAAYLDTLNADTYTFTVSYDPLGLEYVEGTVNEAPAATTFELIVEKADGSVTNISDVSKTYDGTAVSHPAYTSLSAGEVTYEYKGKGAEDSTYTSVVPKDAGAYTVRVSVAADNNYEEASETKNFVIGKAPITVTAKNADKTYGEADPKFPYTISGTVYGNDEEHLVIYVDRTDRGEDVGEYTLKASETELIDDQEQKNTVSDEELQNETELESANQNYDMTFVDGTFTIHRKTIGISWGNTAFTYDGTEKLPTATATATAFEDEIGLTVTGSQINAGTGYTAIVTGITGDKADNYQLPADATKTFGIAKADQNAPGGLEGIAETIDGKADGTITGVDSTMEYRKDDAEGYTAVAEDCTELTDLADGTYYIRYKENDNYNASEDCEIVIGTGSRLNVTLPETQTGYTLTADKTELGWKDSAELTFTLKEGYSKLDNFAVKVTVNGNTITIDDQTGTFGEDGKYTVNDAQTDVSVTVEGVADITAPDAEITLGTNKWNEFFHDITFGLFFKDTQEVKITATDKGSGVDKICYHLSEKALTEDDVKALADSEWTEYKEAFTLDPQDEYIIYAKVTDQVNNIKYISSDKKIVIDSIAPVITGIADGETHYGDTTFTVSDEHIDVVKVDDDPVTLTDGNYTITADGQQHTVVVTDKSGNSSATITITVVTIASLDDDIESITTDNVKSSHKEAIEKVKDLVKSLIACGKDFTDTEDVELSDIEANTKELLNKIAAVSNEMTNITTSVNAYEMDQVTSDDKDTINGLITRIDALTGTENVTETERSELSDVRGIAEDLLKKIGETGEKLSDLAEQMEALEEERITLEDEQKIKDWLEEAEELLESELLTEAEKEILKDSKAAAEELLEKIQGFYPSGVERLAGSDRYKTAYKTADALKRALNVEKFECAIVATGKEYADALSGSYLAAVKQAPILLTNGKADNVAELIAYIRENVAEGSIVYILGGENAVTAELDTIEGYQVKRLAGTDRYETNLQILEEAGLEDAKDLIIVTGQNFADGLSASATGRPILLVKSGVELKEAQKEIIAHFGTGKIYLLGGGSAIDADLEAEVKALAESETNVERISGKDRYETSVKVAETFFGAPRAVVMAYGKNFPDGLCGGPLAAALDIPLILTRDGYTEDGASYIKAQNVTSGYVLGGTGVLSEETVGEVFAAEAMIE